MITRSMKEHTGFTEIPGKLGKAHLSGQIMLFLKALMVLPLIDVTMNASNTFYDIVYQIWFYWIFYPWKNTFPTKKHLGLRHSSAFWEPCYISVLYYTDLSCGGHPWLHADIPWSCTLKSPKNGEWFAAALESLITVFYCPTMWPALRICGVGPVLLLLCLLSAMGCLHSGPLKFAWIVMSFTLWEVSPLAVFSRFLILPYRRVVKAPGYMFPGSAMSSADNSI